MDEYVFTDGGTPIRAGWWLYSYPVWVFEGSPGF